MELSERDPRQARRIRDAVVRYEREGRGDIKRLTGRPGELRLRVGDWRVLLRVNDQSAHVLVVRVAIRRDAYDD
jgi:mRNA interferase RelE/StbE